MTWNPIFNAMAIAILTAALTGLSGLDAIAGSVGPSPYLSFSDSPFNGGSFTYFHLETFEDHLLNTPGVTASPGESPA
jgi:hypothetical protein